MGYFAELLAEPAAQQAGLLSWDEYQKTIGWNNTDAVRGFQALANKLGYSGPVQERTGRQVSMGEGESGPIMIDEWGPAAGLSKVMSGYRFGQGTDSGGNPTATIYDSNGALQDSARVGSSGGSMMNFMSKAIPGLVLGGFGAGALGLAGIGPMAGAGGAGAGAGAGSLGTFEGIGGAMAGGGAPMTAAEFTAGAGGAGAGSFALPATEFGAGFAAPAAPLGDFSLAGSSGAGIDFGANPFGDFSLAGAGTGGAGGASSLLQSLANGAKSIGGDSWLKDLISVGSGLYGMNLAGDARKASDPFAQYRAGYGEQLADLEANPGSIVSRPGFQAGLETIGRKSAATGYYGSGNMASALSRYSGDFYNQEATRLAGLAGAGQTPGAGQALGADLASQSLGSIGYGLAPMLERFMRGG